MTRDDIIAALAAIERTLNDRITVVRVVLDPKGGEPRRIYRGSFFRPPSSQDSEPHHQGETP